MFKIGIYSHGIIIRWDNLQEECIVKDYVDRELTNYQYSREKETGALIKEQQGQYAYVRPDLKTAALLKSELRPFVNYISNISAVIKYVETDHCNNLGAGYPVHGVMNAMYKPRDEQQEAAVAFLEESAPIRTVHAATGFGKTFCGYWTAVRANVRTMFSMEPTHVTTWVKDAKNYSDVTDDDIRIVAGSKELIKLINDGLANNITEKFIFLSSVTWRNWLNSSEEELLRYPIDPIDFVPTIGAGIVIRDEAHESLEALVNQTAFTHTAKMIYLSATLVNDSAYINGIFDKIFPKDQMWTSKPNTHTDITSIFFRTSIELNRTLRFRTPMGYSHLLLEGSLLKKKRASKAYREMMMEMIEGSFNKRHLKGTKCLVLCSTVKMCEFMAEEAAVVFPNFTIGVFAGGRHTDNLYDRDLVFSTPKGAGTGKDVPNLAVVWNTIAIGSTTLQRQILGRGRPIKLYPDVAPRYYMLFNRSIPQHIEYERKRDRDSVGRCKSYRSVDTSIMIRG